MGLLSLRASRSTWGPKTPRKLVQVVKILSETVQNAIVRYLEEVDEHVVRPRYDKMSKVLSMFLESLKQQQVSDLDALGVEHVCVFMETLIARLGEYSGDLSEARTVMKTFARWLRKRGLSPVLYEWFYLTEPRSFFTAVDAAYYDAVYWLWKVVGA